MRQHKSGGQPAHRHHWAGTGAHNPASAWKGLLLKLACSAVLWVQGPAAMAADFLGGHSALGYWGADSELRYPGLPTISAHSSLDPQVFPVGVALSNETHMPWEVQTDQAPNGGGSLRSTGNIDIVQSMVYTVETDTPTQAALRTSGQSQTTGLWNLMDGSGNLITDTFAQGSTYGVLSMRMDLEQAADVRLSGSVWSTNLDGFIQGHVYYFDSQTGQATYLLEREFVAPSENFEFQWRLPADVSVYWAVIFSNAELLPCCNVAYAGSTGWDVLLEASALAPVPEPASAGLLLGGLAALAWRRRALKPDATALEQLP